MAKKTGLGKGLNALFSETLEKDEEIEVKKEEKIIDGEVVQTLKITEVEPNRDQPRKQFDEEALEELSESIKRYGLIQPIIVTKKDGYYQIVAGERRWRAARIAGLKKVPVVVREFAENEIFTIALIENLQREDLNPIEEAIAYQKLIQDLNLKQEEVAEKVSKSRTAITNSMRLLKLDERVQQMLVDEMISEGHGRALVSIVDLEEQFRLAMKVFDEKLSVRETEKLVKKIQENKQKTESSTKQQEKDDSFIYRNLEEKLKQALGTKVEIKKKAKKGGKIEIEYYSIEELERIVELLEVK